MKRGSTDFLRLVIFFLSVGVIALSILALPAMWSDGSAEFPEAAQAIFLIMIGLYMTMIPFFIAAWQIWKLLRYVDQNKVFSDSSVRALGHLKRAAIIIGILYVGGVPLLLPIAQADDAPGLIIVGMVIACIPVAVAVFAALLERLLRNAIDIKSENDLTV